MNGKKSAELHKNVPPDWYFSSIRSNPFQWLWHTVRFREVSRSIEKVDGKVLDVGSADGVFTKIIRDESGAKEIIGLDVLKSSVDWANKHWKSEKNMSFIVGVSEDLPFRARSFDAVFALEVMEHVIDTSKTIEEIYRVTKKNGYAVFLVPTDSLLFQIIWFIVRKFAWAKIWEDCHLQSFNGKNKLSKHVKKVGFKVEEDRTFWLGMLNLVKARKIK